MTKKKKQTIFTVIALITLVALFVGGYYFTSIANELGDLQKTGTDSPFYNLEKVDQESATEPPVWEGDEPVNVLLMGVDARGFSEGEIPRSDTMLVASINPVTKKISLFSLLRDTYVAVPEHGNNRLNTAITHGPNIAMQAASDLLGIPVQYYVYTDFQGFIKLVDAVGGVDFEVEKDLYYVSKADNHEYDIDLKQGMQHLDGEKALMYVRFRHDAMSDFSRTERQRDLLKAIADKLKTTTSIAKLPSILNEVNPYIDTNLKFNDIWKLASLGFQSSLQASEQIPPMNMLEEKKVGGAAVLAVKDSDELKAYVQEVLSTGETSEDAVSITKY
ncbi:LCP family protein [Paenibacillus sp. Marseille-Q4541]|uniref:LCP family protein n=1 Tax=Paenibacillus sp. Marseille-Q4541 TaxID=2831522 RepID=UPI001BA8234D|nr:LCP family protein [Paenibacillus sp. Marseille-Q4541]